MPKILSSGYSKKVYHTIFEHKKGSKFIVMWEFTETKDDYIFKATCKPYVDKKGEQHIGLSKRVDEENQPS